MKSLYQKGTSKTVLLAAIAALCTLPAKAQFAVIDPANLAQGIVNTAKQIIETSSTAKNVINNFKETVKIYEQGREYYDALKSVHNLVKDAKRVQKTVLMVGEISELYVNSFQKIISDPNFTEAEITAIGNGYAILLNESADMLAEVKEIITKGNGLSMSDAERMAVIDRVYAEVKSHRDLVSYYTKKNISISFLRAKKTGDTQRVLELYGNANERYW
jgi:P-type conjugative transfer protein TrbJ